MPNNHSRKHSPPSINSAESTVPDFEPSPKRSRARTQSPTPPPPPPPDLPTVNTKQWRTHSSYTQNIKAGFEYDDQVTTRDYEQLEFIGDGLIRFIVIEKLLDMYPKLTPGAATMMISKLVSEPSLAKLALHYSLPDRLRADKSVIRGLRTNPRIQCDMFEAFIGALFNQNGLNQTRQWLRQLFHAPIKEEYEALKPTYTTPPDAVNALVRLHEYCQRKRVVPIIECESTGTVQEPRFSATIKLRHLKITAEGRTKQHAKNAAAALLWDAIPPSWNEGLDRPVLPVTPLEPRDGPPHLSQQQSDRGDLRRAE